MIFGCSSIFREFSTIVGNYSSKPAVFFKKDNEFKSITYSGLRDQAIRLGNLLYSKGVRESDKVVVLLGNQPEWPVAFIALQYVGAITVPIDINLPPEEMGQLILHAGANFILSSKRFYAGLYAYLKDERDLEVMLVDSPEFLEELKGSPPENRIDPGLMISDDKIAALFYTSGTTNLPKAAMLSYRNLLSNVNAIRKLDISDADDVFISFLPVHHTYSFMVTCLLPLLEGAQISYPASITSEDIFNCIKATNVNVLVGVPQIFLFLHRRIKAEFKKVPFIARLFINIIMELFWLIRKFFGINLNKYLFSRIHRSIGDSLEFMISGGAYLEPKVACDFFKWGFTVLEGYGLTETSPIAAFNSPRRYKIGSVGKPLPGVEIKIVKPNAQGLGEVAIKGPNVMLGYYKRSQETAKVMDNSWFLTGDLGCLDRAGRLYIKGRVDDVIVLSSGKKVNPEEIEKHYGASLFIKEVCVFASRKSKDSAQGKQLMAVIVPDQKHFRERGQVNIEEKIKWELDTLSYRLSSFKRIKGFVISMESLPRTTLGKIIRYKVPDMYAGKSAHKTKRQEELSEEEMVLFSSEVYKKILKYLSGRFKREMALSDHLELDLGLDSLGRIELLLELEQFLKIQIPESQAMELFSANTIKELMLKAKDFLPKEIVETEDAAILWSSILKQKPSNKMLNIIRVKTLPIDKIATVLIIGAFKMLFRVFFLLKVQNRDNFPQKGPCILYANHTTYLDGLIVVGAVPFRLSYTTYYIGFKEVFLHPLLKNMTRLARLVPIDTTLDLVEALQTCAYLLRNSKFICYFPEGGRSPHGEIIKFKKGVGILAKELSVPLLPIYIDGAFRVWPRRLMFPRLSKIKVIVGKPVTVSGLIREGKAKDDSYESITEALRAELINLKPAA
jgi:long-chain acyl-CoA synthetase